MTDTLVTHRNANVAGVWRQAGRLIVTCRLTSGTLVTVTLPDDWQTLVARVAALETAVAAMPNSLEDLTYGG